MRALRVKPIALLLSCACSCAGAADDTALGLKPGAGGLQLKPQPSLIRISPDNKDEVPLFVDADRIQGHQDREIEAEGAVRLRRRGQAISADWLRYDQPEDEVNAQGNVHLEQRGDVVDGTKMRLNLDTTRGAIEKPKYQVQVNTTRGRGEADQIVFEGQGKYRVLRGSYTSCDVGNDDWFVRASDFDIDKERQIGTARDASIIFLGTPILYTPYLSFSLDRQRKSGWLSPTFGSTGNSGQEFSLPYYWNIAPNRDATITPRMMSKRGVQLQNEFRYLDPRYRGELRYEILPDDRVKSGDTRSALSLIHTQSFSNGWNGSLNIQKVSDNTYFTDLSTQIVATSQVLLPRTAVLAKSGNWWNDGTWGFSTAVQHWQTLQTDPLNPLTPPYNTSQLNVVASKLNAGFTDFAFNGNFADFTHPTLINGKRAVAYPSISVPLQTSFAYLTPKVGVHLTHYDIDQSATTAATGLNRAVPIFSTESGLVFERNTTLSNQAMLQTIEPKIYYVYIPYRNQNQIPVFDTGQQDINFATLYTENQFSGNDRINDANQVTVGVTSRLLHQDNGIERLRVGLAQRYYFETQGVTLPGIAPRGSNSSDLLAALSGTIAPRWTADAGWQYATSFSQTQRVSLGTRYQPEPGKVLNLAYRYANGALTATTQPQITSNPLNPSNTLRQLDISGQWPLTSHLSAVARWNYSTADHSLLEGLAGLEYDGGCWAFRVVAHSFATTATTSVKSIFLQLELNGVSKIGSNPLELLRRSVGGYSRQQVQSSRPDDPFPIR
jgi:LPS-assembly protein